MPFYLNQTKATKMTRSGQAYIPTVKERRHLFNVIKQHRHPEKNTAIMRLSFSLGLRVQEIAELQIKDVCQLNHKGTNSSGLFELNQSLSLTSDTATDTSNEIQPKPRYDRKSVTFPIEEFNRIVKQVQSLTVAGSDIKPEQFYPPIKAFKRVSSDLPMVDDRLRDALEAYLQIRLQYASTKCGSEPLFLTQKKTPYSPNSLQRHMALMLRDWAEIANASSHSGRRTLLHHIIHEQNIPIDIAQKIARHARTTSTTDYQRNPEILINNALKNVKD